MAAIDDDPAAAAARFSAFHSRCCCCGKALTDNHSKVYGIGPECRQGMSSNLLDRFIDAMRRAHASFVDQSEQGNGGNRTT